MPDRYKSHNFYLFRIDMSEVNEPACQLLRYWFWKPKSIKVEVEKIRRIDKIYTGFSFFIHSVVEDCFDSHSCGFCIVRLSAHKVHCVMSPALFVRSRFPLKLNTTHLIKLSKWLVYKSIRQLFKCFWWHFAFVEVLSIFGKQWKFIFLVVKFF